MKATIANRCRTGCLALAAALAPAAGGAQSLADPTRPPAHMLDPALAAPADVSANPLQSIILKGKTRRALINGELVKAGDKIDDKVVARIGETEVELKLQDGSKETLRLYPEVEISRGKKKQGATPALRPAPARP